MSHQGRLFTPRNPGENFMCERPLYFRTSSGMCSWHLLMLVNGQNMLKMMTKHINDYHVGNPGCQKPTMTGDGFDHPCTVILWMVLSRISGVLTGSSYSSWAVSQPGDYQVVSASKSRIGRPCAWNSSSSLASPDFFLQLNDFIVFWLYYFPIYKLTEITHLTVLTDRR